MKTTMIIKDYLPIKTKRRPGLKLLGVRYLVAHDTGNPNSTARQNVNYYKQSTNEIEASAHTFIDDKDIIECIPLDEKAYHVRRKVSDAIDYALGIELCYFPSDYNRSKQAYDNYMGYIADLCKRFNLEPSRGIVGHYKLDSARRSDPLNAFKYINISWEQFIQDVKNSLTIDNKVNETCSAEKKEIASLKKLITDLYVYIKKLLGV